MLLGLWNLLMGTICSAKVLTNSSASGITPFAVAVLIGTATQALTMLFGRLRRKLAWMPVVFGRLAGLPLFRRLRRKLAWMPVVFGRLRRKLAWVPVVFGRLAGLPLFRRLRRKLAWMPVVFGRLRRKLAWVPVVFGRLAGLPLFRRLRRKLAWMPVVFGRLWRKLGRKHRQVAGLAVVWGGLNIANLAAYRAAGMLVPFGTLTALFALGSICAMVAQAWLYEPRKAAVGASFSLLPVSVAMVAFSAQGGGRGNNIPLGIAIATVGAAAVCGLSFVQNASSHIDEANIIFGQFTQMLAFLITGVGLLLWGRKYDHSHGSDIWAHDALLWMMLWMGAGPLIGLLANHLLARQSPINEAVSQFGPLVGVLWQVFGQHKSVPKLELVGAGSMMLAGLLVLYFTIKYGRKKGPGPSAKAETP
ncbi:hypothetical protein [Actinoallomurus sp. NPDC050550]|uniref:hypothetical protein n=1 Tax=Actinoallomurus sp. NPDC050550 TaxID=3154937 RepID=UPI0033C1496C